MKETFKGYLFNRIEEIGNKKYNHIGYKGEDKNCDDLLPEFVPKIGMRRKVKFTIESLKEPKIIKE